MAVPHFGGGDRILGAVGQLATYNAQQRAIEEQKRRERERKRANQFGMIGGGLGAIGGAYLGGPAGAAAGYSMGSMIGQTVAGSPPPPEQAVPAMYQAAGAYQGYQQQQQQQAAQQQLLGAVAPVPPSPYVMAPGAQQGQVPTDQFGVPQMDQPLAAPSGVTPEQYQAAIQHRQTLGGLLEMNPGAVTGAITKQMFPGGGGKEADPMVTYEAPNEVRQSMPLSRAQATMQASGGRILGPSSAAPVVPGGTSEARGMTPQTVKNPKFGKTEYPNAPEWVLAKVGPDGTPVPTDIEAPPPSSVAGERAQVYINPKDPSQTDTSFKTGWLPVAQYKAVLEAQGKVPKGYQTFTSANGSVIAFDPMKPEKQVQLAGPGMTMNQSVQAGLEVDKMDQQRQQQALDRQAAMDRTMAGKQPSVGQTTSYQSGDQRITEQWDGKQWKELGRGPVWEQKEKPPEAKLLKPEEVPNGQPGYIYKRTGTGDIQVMHKPIPIGGDIGPEKRADISMQLRREYNQQTGDFVKARDGYNRILTSYERATSEGNKAPGVADIGMIFGYMKMLDPPSTVREGEAATVENSGGVPAYYRNLYNKVAEGQKLEENVRNEILENSRGLYKQQKIQLAVTQATYTGLAKGYGVDPGFVVTSRTQNQPNRPPPLMGAVGQNPTQGALTPPQAQQPGQDPLAVQWTLNDLSGMDDQTLRIIDWQSQSLPPEVQQEILRRLREGEQ